MSLLLVRLIGRGEKSPVSKEHQKHTFLTISKPCHVNEIQHQISDYVGANTGLKVPECSASIHQLVGELQDDGCDGAEGDVGMKM